MSSVHLPGPAPFIDPCWDPVFKSIFTKDTTSSKIARRDLLSALLEQNVADVIITANEPAVAFLGDRQIRYDINCTLDSGEHINIEMTLYPNIHESVKLEYYSGRLFTGQGIRGKSYNDLCRTYQISILANRKLFNDTWFDHRFFYYDPEKNISLGGRTAILVLELEKLRYIAGKPVSEMRRKEWWGIFFKYFNDPEKQEMVREITRKEEGIAMATEVLWKYREDEAAFFYAMSKEKYELDMRSHEEDARELGHAQGRAQGWEEAQAEIRRQDLETAKKMQDRGFPADEIRELLPRLSAEDIL
ncbi:MAG: Rpn family recombination-promoting nuclease/putative transposase [Treponema sp.]|jgi:predicted transposase/invertase (TIGR01784 family)|nr:Rpn family recombination-promoting nuclease/putative transposase [Treponema sp.]